MKQEWKSPVLEELDAKQTANFSPGATGDGFDPFSES